MASATVARSAVAAASAERPRQRLTRPTFLPWGEGLKSLSPPPVPEDALALRHGHDVTDAPLGCPSAIAPESAPDPLGDVAGRIAGVWHAFDAALAEAADSSENE